MGIQLKTILLLILGPFPGIGHIYLGRKKKGLALLLVFGGVVTAFILSDMLLVKVLMVMAYLSIDIPAWLETYQIGGQGRKKIDTDARWYTITLLLFTGFAALPLLWQNPNFSRKGKVLWTVIVPILAIVFFSVIIKYSNAIEAVLREIFT